MKGQNWEKLIIKGTSINFIILIFSGLPEIALSSDYQCKPLTFGRKWKGTAMASRTKGWLCISPSAGIPWLGKACVPSCGNYDRLGLGNVYLVFFVSSEFMVFWLEFVSGLCILWWKCLILGYVIRDLLDWFWNLIWMSELLSTLYCMHNR